MAGTVKFGHLVYKHQLVHSAVLRTQSDIFGGIFCINFHGLKRYLLNYFSESLIEFIADDKSYCWCEIIQN